jgi:RNA polymerase II elongation factor ELL
MPSLTIPESGLLLGSSQSSAKSDSPYTDIFTLSLADSVIEDMIKCVRDAKPIQLSLGNDPVSGSFSLIAIDCSWLRN